MTVLSGFVGNGSEWIGCAADEDELRKVHAQMIDDAVHDGRPHPGELTVRDATPEEVERFNGEAGIDLA